MIFLLEALAHCTIMLYLLKIYEYMKESVRAKAASEAEELQLRLCESTPPPWAVLSRSRCTCTCHHNSYVSQPGEETVSGASLGIGGDSCRTTPIRSLQNTGDAATIDVSFWRDARVGMCGACVGEYARLNIGSYALCCYLKY